MTRSVLVTLYLSAFIISLSGCSHLPNAPRTSSSAIEDATELQSYMLSSANAPALQIAYDKSRRDTFIDNKVILINLRFSEFVTTLAANKKSLDAGHDILSLGLSVAGTLVGGVQSKENLAAAASLVSGSKIAIDKHFYFEQTIPVLITSMENKRKEVLIRILQGRQNSYESYPMAQAQTDLAEYEAAGSLTGALRGLATQASARQTELDAQLSSLIPATKAQIDAARDASAAVAAIIQRNDLAEINRALRSVGAEKYDYSAVADAAKALEVEVRKMKPADTPKWKAALNF